ncbi:MAG: FKBP-type peptidyl-prolyl cis-trans isomerase [Bacteroidales bacterium]
MRKVFVFVCLCVCVCACSEQEEVFNKTSDGLVYLYRIDKPDTETPQNGDRLLLKIAYYNEVDSLLFDSREISRRFIQEYKEPEDTVPSIYHIYQMLSEGDSITAKINAQHFFNVHRKNAVPPGVKKDEMLRFEVKLDSVFSKEEFVTRAEQVINKLCKKEQKLLEEYIASEYPDVEPTESGMYIIHEQKGSGIQPSKDATVTVHYTAAYLSGDIIYSSAKQEQPLTFSVSDERVWPGLSEGVQHMRKDGYAKFIVPSELAAGKHGEDPIPPCKTIVLKVALIAVN